MRIAFTGGGTGGHFYPIISVAEAIHDIVAEEKLVEPELYYIGPSVLDPRALAEQNIRFKQASAGKVRRYLSLRNVFDFFRTGIGIVQALFKLYALYPDVVLSKGGYASFPTTVAARLLRIPVVVHESDAHPGLANLIAARHARAVAISFSSVMQYFKGVPKDTFALTGNPIRRTLFMPAKEGAHEYLGLSRDVPTILILGGSQGAQAINNVVVNSLPKLVEKYQVIHQTGEKNIEEVDGITQVILRDNEHKDRYKPFPFLNTLALRMASGIADLVIMRAGAGSIFEAAAWGTPSIVVPIPQKLSHDQAKNAFAYARAGAAVAMEQENLTPNLLISEIDRILENESVQREMSESAKAFAKPEAAHTIAKMLLNIALEHET